MARCVEIVFQTPVIRSAALNFHPTDRINGVIGYGVTVPSLKATIADLTFEHQSNRIIGHTTMVIDETVQGEKLHMVDNIPCDSRLG